MSFLLAGSKFCKSDLDLKYDQACLVKVSLNRVQGAFNKFPDFFGMSTFINRAHKKL